MSDQYVSIKIPASGSISVKTVKLVVRSDEGETLASGNVAMQFDARFGDEMIIMSPDMVTTMFGHSTMQHLYEKYENRAERILEEMDIVSGEEYDGAKLGFLISKAMEEESDKGFEDVIEKTKQDWKIIQELMNDADRVDDVEKRTVDEWCREYGALIADPDGWRDLDAPAWSKPITLVDFYRRLSNSTARVESRTRLTNDVTNLRRRQTDKMEGN